MTSDNHNDKAVAVHDPYSEVDERYRRFILDGILKARRTMGEFGIHADEWLSFNHSLPLIAEPLPVEAYTGNFDDYQHPADLDLLRLIHKHLNKAAELAYVVVGHYNRELIKLMSVADEELGEDWDAHSDMLCDDCAAGGGGE